VGLNGSYHATGVTLVRLDQQQTLLGLLALAAPPVMRLYTIQNVHAGGELLRQYGVSQLTRFGACRTRDQPHNIAAHDRSRSMMSTTSVSRRMMNCAPAAHSGRLPPLISNAQGIPALFAQSTSHL